MKASKPTITLSAFQNFESLADIESGMRLDIVKVLKNPIENDDKFTVNKSNKPYYKK